VDVWVRGLVDGKWTNASIITILLQPRAAPHGQTTPSPKPEKEVPLREWAGWSAHNSDPKPNTYIQGTWIVPEVDCADAPKERTRAAMWVGLWGDHADPKKNWLPQIGTLSQCEDGKAKYFGVYQVMHCNLFCWVDPSLGFVEGGTGPQPIPETEMSVEPGDRVIARVVYAGKTLDGRLHFELYLENAASKQRGYPGLFAYQKDIHQGVPVGHAAAHSGCILESDAGGLARFRGAHIRSPD
jgi:hypothetical protein